MAKLTLESQNKIAETMLIALYARAVESRQPQPMLTDERAAQMVEQIDYDFHRYELKGHDQTNLVMRVRQFDRFAQDFLARRPQAVVVNIGCGLDTRFERVDNGRVEWYDLDLPEVIAFRQKLIPELDRCYPIGCSVLEAGWLSVLGNHPGSAWLFIAEGVFPYFTEQQVSQLFLLLAGAFPGCELVTDGMTALMVGMHNLQLRLSKVGARLNWGLKDGHQPESWGKGIQLLDEWFYFDTPEPRLGTMQLMRYLPAFGKGVGIFHYRLGHPASG